MRSAWYVTVVIAAIAVLMAFPGAAFLSQATANDSHSTPTQGSGLSAAVTSYAVTISAGCTVTPSGAPISHSGSTFSLTSSFAGTIDDQCNDSTLDGAGLVLNDTPGLSFGVFLESVTGITVTDLTVTNESRGGIYIEYANNIRITSDTSNGTGYGFEAYLVNNLTVTGNHFSSTEGLDGDAGSNWLISGNQLMKAEDGFYIDYVTGLSILQNNVSYSTGTQEIGVEESTGVVVMGNAVYNTVAYTHDDIYVEDSGPVSVSWNNGSYGDEGIYVEDSTNVSVDHNRITTAGYAADVEYVNNVAIENNTLLDASDDGIYVYLDNGVTIAHNVVTGSVREGMYLEYVTNGAITQNNASMFADAGVDLEYCQNVTITYDQASYSTASGDGFDLYEDSAITLSWCNATYDGEGLYAEESGTVSASHDDFAYAGDEGVYLDEDNSVTIADSVYSYSADEGIYAEEINGLSVVGGNANNAADEGVYLDEISGAVVTGVGANNSGSEGFYVEDSAQVALTNDWATPSYDYGFELEDNQAITLSGDNAVRSADYSIYADDNAGLTVTGNNLSKGDVAVYLDDNSGVNVSGNTFWADNFSFYVDENSGLIYHNNFIADLAWQLPLDAPNPAFAWFSPYPVGGNYWSNYTGVDVTHGPAQNLSGSDGIGDTPFVLDSTNVDQYPLTHPWKTRAVTFTQTGLPASTDWSVLWNGQTFGSSGAAIVITNPNGANTSYAYTVSPVPGYHVTPSAGVGTQSRTNISINLVFTAVNYTVTFAGAGFSATTAWSVTLNGHVTTGLGRSIALPEPNGTYNFTIGAVPNYSVSPTHGTFAVAGTNVTETLTVVEMIFDLNFTESGLGSGTNWSVTLNGVTLYSVTPTITFSEVNGTFAYAVGSVGGYNSPVPATGNATVHGAAAEVGVAFSTPSSSTSLTSGTTGLLLALLIVVAVLAAVGWVLAMRGRKRSPPGPLTPASAPGTPPAGVSGEQPAAPPTGSGQGLPPPPPSP